MAVQRRFDCTCTSRKLFTRNVTVTVSVKLIVKVILDRMGLEPHCDAMKMFVIDTMLTCDRYGHCDVTCKQTLKSRLVWQ